MRPAIVIPTLEEESELPRTLATLAADAPFPIEVVVVDGGSRDRSREVAVSLGARVLVSAPSRAAQMNLGAEASTGDPLVFLHADCRLGARHLRGMAEALASPGVVFGSFPIRIDAAGPGFRVIETVANLRTRIDRTPYGDQALFVRRSAFRAVGGFPPLTFLEDVALGRRLQAEGRFAFLTAHPLPISGRRWQREGLWRTTFKNWTTRALWELGASPDWLGERYRRTS